MREGGREGGCVSGCPRHVELRNNVRLLLNVELRNYVISLRLLNVELRNYVISRQIVI